MLQIAGKNLMTSRLNITIAMNYPILGSEQVCSGKQRSTRRLLPELDPHLVGTKHHRPKKSLIVKTKLRISIVATRKASTHNGPQDLPVQTANVFIDW
jgi:hypothetical protein